MNLKTVALGVGITVAGTMALLGGGSAQAAEVNYVVQPGDTLSKISEAHFGDISQINYLAESNGISDIHLIQVGQTLKFDSEAGPIQTQPVIEAVETVEAVETYNAEPTIAEPVTQVNSSSAKEWIAQKESSGSYGATNGRYIGRYQLDSSYLNGDYSEANQERVADQYVADRYGSWEAAQQFWMANGWY